MKSWNSADSYEKFMGRWSLEIGKHFIEMLAETTDIVNKRWVDVGCGTGALSEVVFQKTSPEYILGIDPSQDFIDKAQQKINQSNVEFTTTTAENIPLPSESIDFVVSGLALNFMSDPNTSLSEMKRVLKPNGLLACYVWDYADKMEFLRYFWDAVVQLDPESQIYDEGEKFPICNPNKLQELFNSIGMKNIRNDEITIQTPFSSFDKYWKPFFGGQGPAGEYLASVNDEKQTQIAFQIENSLPISTDGSITLIAKAFTIQGKK